MIIRNNQQDFDSDELIAVDRSQDGETVLVILESETIAF